MFLKRMVGTLEDHSRTPVPQNVLYSIRDWASSAGVMQLSNDYVITADDAELVCWLQELAEQVRGLPPDATAAVFGWAIERSAWRHVIAQMLAGEFLFHFGGFLSHELRMSDFDLGYRSTVAIVALVEYAGDAAATDDSRPLRK